MTVPRTPIPKRPFRDSALFYAGVAVVFVVVVAMGRGGPQEPIVVDREPAFTLAASFLWVMTGDRTPQQVSRPLERLQRKGIEVVRGDVERITPERREATVSGKTLTGDNLVIALGAEFALDAIPALAEAGLTFCTLDGATRLREALAEFRHGKIVDMQGCATRRHAERLARRTGARGERAVHRP